MPVVLLARWRRSACRPRESVTVAMPWRDVLTGEGAGPAVLVARIEQAADDRDPERAAELDGGGVGRGRDAAVGFGTSR